MTENDNRAGHHAGEPARRGTTTAYSNRPQASTGAMDDTSALALPPLATEAEQAVLGAALLDIGAFGVARAIVEPRDFYTEAHRTIWRALCRLVETDNTTDITLLQTRLSEADQLEAVGGRGYVTGLMDACATTRNVEKYAKAVREASRKRALQAFFRRAVERTADGAPLGEIVAATQSAIYDATQGETADTFKAQRFADFVTADLPAALWIVERLLAGGGLTFLFSRPGLGKSFLSFEVARLVACPTSRRPLFLDDFQIPTGGPAIYFNLEMPASQFQERLRRLERHHPVGDAPLYVVNEPLALNDPASFGRFRTLCETLAPACVVIDPMIRALPGVDENSAAEVSAALAPACDLAREFGFGLWVDHHATKGGERRGLDSLAGSRDFAARCDVALLVEDAPEEGGGGLLRVTCVKSRWGAAPAPFFLRVQDDPDGLPAIVPAETPNARSEVLDVLRMAAPASLTVKEIVTELDGVKSRDQINRALDTLVNRGLAKRVRHGLYTLAEGVAGD